MVTGMVTGSLLYTPGPLNTVASMLGLPATLTDADTFRLPVWLTLGSAIGVVLVTLSMREPPRQQQPAATGLRRFVRPLQQAGGSWAIRW